MSHDPDHPGDHPDRRGLSRRQVLGVLGGAPLALPFLGGCGAASPDASPGTDPGDPACPTIPRETAGPFPADGTNGVDALALAGIVRSDLRASLAPASGIAEGVPLTLELRLVDSSASCVPLAARAIYVWQCDREGAYSMYSPAIAGESYLRGVQETDASGAVRFTTIVPACYPGRWPHIHVAIYPSLADATHGASKLHVTQIALPKDTCDAVYATSGYEASATRFVPLSLARDGVFRDGSDRQLARVTGSVTDGYVANLTIAIPT